MLNQSIPATQADAGEVSGLKDILRRKEQEIDQLKSANLQLNRQLLATSSSHDLKTENTKLKNDWRFKDLEVKRLTDCNSTLQRQLCQSKEQLDQRLVKDSGASEPTSFVKDAFPSNKPNVKKLQKSDRFDLAQPGPIHRMSQRSSLLSQKFSTASVRDLATVEFTSAFPSAVSAATVSPHPTSTSAIPPATSASVFPPPSASGFTPHAAPSASGFTQHAAPSAPGFTQHAAPSASGFTPHAAPSASGFTQHAAPSAPSFTQHAAPSASGFAPHAAPSASGFTPHAAPSASGFAQHAAPSAPGFTQHAAPSAPGFTQHAAPSASGFTPHAASVFPPHTALQLCVFPPPAHLPSPISTSLAVGLGAASSSFANTRLKTRKRYTDDAHLSVFLEELSQSAKKSKTALMLRRSVIASPFVPSPAIVKQLAVLLRDAGDHAAILEAGSTCLLQLFSIEALKSEVLHAMQPLIDVFVGRGLARSTEQVLINTFACVAEYAHLNCDHVTWADTFQKLAASPPALISHVKDGLLNAHKVFETLWTHPQSFRCLIDSQGDGIEFLHEQVLLPSDSVERCRIRLAALSCLKATFSHENSFNVLAHRFSGTPNNLLQSVVLMTSQEIINWKIEQDLRREFCHEKAADPILAKYKTKLLLAGVKWIVAAGNAAFGAAVFFKHCKGARGSSLSNIATTDSGKHGTIAKSGRKLTFDIGHCWVQLSTMVTLMREDNAVQPAFTFLSADLGRLQGIAELSRPPDE